MPSARPGWQSWAQPRIAEDRRLRADLIFDKSKLKERRIRVVWLSPNDWDNDGGFRYGNVRFTYDWASLVEDKRPSAHPGGLSDVPAATLRVAGAGGAGAAPPWAGRGG